MPELKSGQPQVAIVGQMPCGRGTIGKNHIHESLEHKAVIADQLADYAHPVNVFKTIDCVEDRRYVLIGGKSGEIVVLRIAEQMPGGAYFALTKAAVAAQADYLKGAKNFLEAFKITASKATAAGFKDSAHVACGASGGLIESITNQVPLETQALAAPIVTSGLVVDLSALAKNQRTKTELLDSGYYVWDPAYREDYVSSEFPENFAQLPKYEHGGYIEHDACGLFIVKQPGIGFQKTAFNIDTGHMAFGYTPSSIVFNQMVDQLGASEEERTRMRLEGFLSDPLNVLYTLVPEEFDIYQSMSS